MEATTLSETGERTIALIFQTGDEVVSGAERFSKGWPRHASRRLAHPATPCWGISNGTGRNTRESR